MLEGQRNDEGKLRFDLIPVGPLEEVARAYTVGATKYADRNWEQGIKWGRMFAALCRHLYKWWAGESRDKEGQHHLAAVVFHAMALIEFEKTHPELDDRPTTDAKKGSRDTNNETPARSPLSRPVKPPSIKVGDKEDFPIRY